MKLVRCENGHFYDEERYGICPFCERNRDTFVEEEMFPGDAANNSKQMDIELPPELSLFGAQKILGESQTSKVFRLIPKMKYALKVVDIKKQTEERAVDREYRIAKQLEDEKYFVTYYAMYKYGDKAYMVQQELKNLLSYIGEDSQQRRIFKSIKILEDIAEAIAVMHKKGIMHLDVKPTNIFVDQEGHGKLGDFSMACEIDLFQKKPYRGGTPKYFAPEIYEIAGYSGKEDMYSFGITMYYILSEGEYPYDFRKSATRTADSVYIASAKIPDELQDIIKKATAYRPDDRYENMEEICKRIHQVIQMYDVLPQASLKVPDGFLLSEIEPMMEFRQSDRPSGFYPADIAYSCMLPSKEEDWALQKQEREQLPISKVQFSAVAPKSLVKGEYAIIHLAMYQEAFRSVVDDLIKEADSPVKETRSGLLKVQEGASVKVILSSPDDIVIENSVEEQEWVEKYLLFDFAVMLPEKYAKKQVLFTATVYINDVIATRLKFIAKCWSLREQKLNVTRDDIFSAFMSYASKDRGRVAMIVQGMQKARPDMDIFFDAESLRSGENWERALWKEIDQRDTLFLCWSHHAAESKWVDAEWRYAYKHKGIEAIEPVPLESPSSCPPPEELKEMHFNDRMLYIIQAESAGMSIAEEQEPLIRIKICSTDQILEFHQSAVTVGRGEHCDVVLEDHKISRRHIKIYRRSAEEYVIEDLGSSNGTFLESINAEVLPNIGVGVRKGEIIRIGDERLQLC